LKFIFFSLSLFEQTREEDLEDLFGKYGKIKDCRIASKFFFYYLYIFLFLLLLFFKFNIVDNQTNRSRGFAFITMEEASEAEEALNAISGTQIEGREVKVENATGRGSRDRGGRDNYRGGRDYNRGYDRYNSRGN
jgi:RNA recognition motif-containing protein